MDTTKERSTSSAAGGIGSELQRFKENGSASVAELREFVGHMRGKNAQEMLGVIAQSHLASNIVVATLAFVVLLAGFTVGPYYYQQNFPGSTAEQPVAEGQDAESAETSPTPDADASAVAGAETPASDAADSEAVTATPDVQNLPAVLGIDETKTAPLDENPLEDKLDNLLDGTR